ncbi:MAG: YcxB family protein [Candidatus Galacturonibacter soehngenii]|nr:YcxB family protein [Candidatus Galacturonibacter soehngenii]
MKYQFRYKNTPIDFLQLSLYYTYGSIVGVCNTIFTVAMILLTNQIWAETTNFVRLLLLFSICLFPIIQPTGVYVRAKKQAADAKEVEIYFDDSGIQVKSGGEVSNLEWKNIKKVSKKPTMVVLFSTTTHGFILSNRVLGDKHKEFYNYVVSKMSH